MGVEYVGVIVGEAPLVDVAPTVTVGMSVAEFAVGVTLPPSGVPARRVAEMIVAACWSTVRDGAAPGRLHPARAKMIIPMMRDRSFLVIVMIPVSVRSELYLLLYHSEHTMLFCTCLLNETP
jgi:hypothetical protein